MATVANVGPLYNTNRLQAIAARLDFLHVEDYNGMISLREAENPGDRE